MMPQIPANDAQQQQNEITQPRTQPGAPPFQMPAARAGFGRNNKPNPTLPNDTSNGSWDRPVTGPPSIHPFQQQTPGSSPGHWVAPTTAGPSGSRHTASDWVAPTTAGPDGSLPRAGTPSTDRPEPVFNEEMIDASGPFWRNVNNSPPGADNSPPVITDHDYTSRPTHLADHSYYTQQTNVTPPPGFNANQGRPQRTTRTPNRYYDYQLY